MSSCAERAEVLNVALQSLLWLVLLCNNADESGRPKLKYEFHSLMSDFKMITCYRSLMQSEPILHYCDDLDCVFASSKVR